MPDKQKPFRFTMKNGRTFTGYGESRKEVLLNHLTSGMRFAGRRLSRAEVDDPNSTIVLVDSATFERYFGESFDEIAEDAFYAAFPPRKPEIFMFKMNDGTRHPFQGESEVETLMEHLIQVTRRLGHQVSFKEAEDPTIIYMVHPSEFVLPFGEFDEAARTAWSRAR